MNKIMKVTIATLVMIGVMLAGGAFYMYDNGLSGKYVNTEPKEGQIKVACVGDSITYGHGVSGWQKNNYPAVLQEILGEEYHVANFGSSGACVNPEGDQPYISREVYQNALAYDADVIVFMIGTNDSKPENWNGMESFMKDYVDLLWRVAEGDKTPKIIVGTCAEAYFLEDADTESGLAKYDIQPLLVDEIAAKILKETDSASYIYTVDVHALTEQHPEWFEEDGIHPNNDGAKGIAEAIAKAIRP